MEKLRNMANVLSNSKNIKENSLREKEGVKGGQKS